MTKTARSPQGFHRFELHEALERGVREAGFETPRPIQERTIPAALDGDDVLGLAQTGTGKTAAFALPLLDWLLEENLRCPRALVIAPTRELAMQITEEIQLLARFTKLKVVSIFGGVPARRQIDALRRGPEIVVGCPGRILDLVDQGALKLNRIETLVLDEADHMFDMGFLPSVRKILALLPRERQNLLFSATMPREIRRLADEVLHEPHVVELADTRPAETIDHALYPADESRKRDMLEHFVSSDSCHSAIVFTRTKHRARRLAQQLERGGHRAVALQGNMSQGQRQRAMAGFRSGQHRILVATDIAARGIDVCGVSHVINYDVPNTSEAYTHRIGRTGRSERAGIACTFVTPEDQAWIRATEKMIGSPIPRRTLPGFEAMETTGSAPKPRKTSGGRSGQASRQGQGAAPKSRGGQRRRRRR